jgi:hypothetical protein
MAQATSVITKGLLTKKQNSDGIGCSGWRHIDEVAEAIPRIPLNIDETTDTLSEWHFIFHERIKKADITLIF